MTNSSKGNGFGVDFDTYWKEILDLIEPATRFFLPALHQQVDWSIDYISLEQELRNLYARKKGRVKRTDKLFRFKLLNGEDHYLLFHLEIEAFPTALFPERMFEYFIRHRFKYSNTPITMLAIFVGDKPTKPLQSYSVDCFGTECTLKYNTFSVAAQTEQQLLESDNPFALVVLANLYVIQSKSNVELRTQFKRKLLKHLATRNYSYEKFKKLFNFAVFFMTLPPEKEKKIIQFMSKQTQAQTQAKKLTYAQQAEAYGDNLFGILFKAKYGQTPEVFVEVAQQQIDKAQQQIDKAQQQLDMARQQADKAQQQADKAQQQADRLQEKERKIIVYMYKTVRLSAQEIAKELEVDLTYVESVLANLPPENN
ncbi:MAG: hypothetical protein RIR11_4266 [Bacteroidota bacterium]